MQVALEELGLAPSVGRGDTAGSGEEGPGDEAPPDPPLPPLLNHKAACPWIAALNLLAARTQQLEVTVGVMHAHGGTASARDCCVEKTDQRSSTSEPS